MPREIWTDNVRDATDAMLLCTSHGANKKQEKHHAVFNSYAHEKLDLLDRTNSPAAPASCVLARITPAALRWTRPHVDGAGCKQFCLSPPCSHTSSQFHATGQALQVDPAAGLGIARSILIAHHIATHFTRANGSCTCNCWA